jgi:hypothetical protein
VDATIHTLILYGVFVVALAAALATRRRRDDDPLPPWTLAHSLWPFFLVAVLEALSLNANGHLVVEWALPCVASAVFILFRRSDKVIRWALRGLVLSAVVLWLHGGWLLTSGYVTRTSGLAPGRKTESAWFTPLTGLRRESR